MSGRPTLQSAALPGLRLRAYAGEADIPAIVAIQNAENEADSIPERTSADERAAEYRHASDAFDVRRDVTIAELDDRPVAFANREWVDFHSGDLREYRVGGAVHPEFRRRGVGTALLRENERRSRELAATHETDRRPVLGASTGDQQTAARALLGEAGYRETRWFFDMIRPTLDDVPDLTLPGELQLRAITPDLYRRVWDADQEAFRDHWGGHDDSTEALQRYLDGPDTDPSLWLIAFDGEEIAGGVINAVYREENAALGVRRGWLDSVFTRRPWRRRGLARALIARSLVLLKERGMNEAMLGVDADNPLGALGLYQGVGFRVKARYSAWHKPLEAAE
ncbi:MAG TPA: GNAT family N-acetyltransferase [Candidatus Limnocylindria bacterium]|nr:GNAT family N-acetyltransferase [Candidatus Limnocylindria bacterium]